MAFIAPGSGIVSIKCNVVSRTTRKPSAMMMTPTATPPIGSALRHTTGNRTANPTAASAAPPDNMSTASFHASAINAELPIRRPVRIL